MKTNLTNHTFFLKRTNAFLFLILLLMIACFFTLSESVSVTRTIKVMGRMGCMLLSIALYYNIIRYGAINTLEYKNISSPLLYLIYLTLGFASFLWSTNPYYSALQWFMTVQSLVFAYFYIKSIKVLDYYFQGHSIRLYHLLGNCVFVIQLLFIVGIIINPLLFFRLTHGGEEARLGGTIMNPNELGMLAVLGISCLLFDLYQKKNRTWTIIKILLIFFALYLTGSRSSLIGAILIIFFHIKQTKGKTLKVTFITMVVLVTPIAMNDMILKGEGSSQLNEVTSLTGRLPFWEALLTEGLPREPLLGFGYMRIDYKDNFQGTHTYAGNMTHNTFIQVLMNLGFIGLCIVVFQLFFTLYAFLSENKETKLILIGMIIPLLINSFTEFGIFGESNYGILFYQMIILSISFKNNPNLSKVQRLHLKNKRPELVL
jgi:exopolysaccharide production protein ExoQ